MNDYSCRIFRTEVYSVTGKTYCFRKELENVIKNLSCRCGKGVTFDKDLKQHKISAQELISEFNINFDLKNYNIDPRSIVYEADVVWNYLKSLEQQEKIRLAEYNLNSFSDILKAGWNVCQYSQTRDTSGKVSKKYTDSDFRPPSCDNGVKIIEGG